MACMGRSDVHVEVWWGDLKEGDHLEDSRKREGNIRRFLYIGWVGVKWIGLAQVRDRWRTVVNTVMNSHIYQNKNITQKSLLNLLCAHVGMCY